MKLHFKKWLAAALCLVLLAALAPVCPVRAEAVDLYDDAVFLKQTDNACTLYSVLMMFRRGAILNGDPGWDGFTEANYRGEWWIEGVGIKNSFSGAGMRAENVSLDGAGDAAGRKRLFIDLLSAHPEGLAIWLARGNLHAVLLTDYDSAADVFYCADPSPSAPVGRIPLAQSVLAEAGYVGRLTGKSNNTQEDVLAHITAYWYIAEGVTGALRVQRSPQRLTVDGAAQDVEKYNIDGSNYFKLRDLAYLLNGTGSRFSVGWDAAAGTVTVVSGAPYVPDGSELIVGADRSGEAKISAQRVVINGAERADLSVYNIGGHNFFQLRELGEALGFDVDYDAATDTAMVRSR